MSPQGASARMEAQIMLYLQEQAKPVTEKKQQKTNQKEVVQKEVTQKEAARKEVEKEVVTIGDGSAAVKKAQFSEPIESPVTAPQTQSGIQDPKVDTDKEYKVQWLVKLKAEKVGKEVARSKADKTTIKTTPRHKRDPAYIYYDKDGNIEPSCLCCDEDEWITADGIDEEPSWWW